MLLRVLQVPSHKSKRAERVYSVQSAVGSRHYCSQVAVLAQPLEPELSLLCARFHQRFVTQGGFVFFLKIGCALRAESVGVYMCEERKVP